MPSKPDDIQYLCDSPVLIPGLTNQTSGNFHVYKKKTLVRLTTKSGPLNACLSHYKLMNMHSDL